MNHQELCERAMKWLRGTRRCNPVFSNIASCSEIPDAIGWSSSHGWRGSTVIECKCSVGDFYADKKKYVAYQEPEHGWTYPAGRLTKKEIEERGYRPIALPSMGDFRFYLCEPTVLTAALVEQHMPDHGLIIRHGHAMHVVRPAPRRERVDKDSEIRYLRFAIINGKQPYVPGIRQMVLEPARSVRAKQ